MSEVNLKKLEHHHLIDGKYLKEDVIPQLRDNIERLLDDVVCSRLMLITKGILEEHFKQFEDECVAYDRSTLGVNAMIVYEKTQTKRCDVCGSIARSLEDIIVETSNGRRIRIEFKPEEFEDPMDVCNKCSDDLLEKARREVRHET